MSLSILNTSNIGSTASACVTTNNLTRIFYQAANGDLCMLSATGTPYGKTHYNNGVVLPSASVRANTPIAAVWWAAMSQIRVYFIDPNNNLVEISVNSSSLPGVGLNNVGWTAATGSGFLYAMNTGTDIRVGFQMAMDPQIIFEAELTSAGWQVSAVAGDGGAQLNLLNYTTLGSTASALIAPKNGSCIYYQNVNGDIHAVGSGGTPLSGASYSDKPLIPAAGVRANTPIAAVQWSNGAQTRVYFIDNNNQLCELTPGLTPVKLGWAVAPKTGFLYAINLDTDIRVGFQSAVSPNVITEGEYTSAGWKFTQIF
jgi:hypothetical protein